TSAGRSWRTTGKGCRRQPRGCRRRVPPGRRPDRVPWVTPARQVILNDMPKIEKTDSQWREGLKPQQNKNPRKAGTEAPLTGQYWDTKADGTYTCAACGTELFSSDTKFDSGTGWPSFTDPMNTENVTLHRDLSHFMIRTEVRCGTCGGHLGHVFDDGPGAS